MYRLYRGISLCIAIYRLYRLYRAIKEIRAHLSHLKVISTVQNHYFTDILGPINLDNIDIMQDWVVEEENLLDKDDFDMDWEAIEESLITSLKIINEKVFNDEKVLL